MSTVTPISTERGFFVTSSIFRLNIKTEKIVQIRELFSFAVFFFDRAGKSKGTRKERDRSQELEKKQRKKYGNEID